MSNVNISTGHNQTVFQANKKHPEFLTTYQNTLQNIKMELSVLEVLLHQEALVSILALLQSIQNAVEKPTAPVIEPAPMRRSRRSSVASSLSFAVKRINPGRRGEQNRPILWHAALVLTS